MGKDREMCKALSFDLFSPRIPMSGNDPFKEILTLQSGGKGVETKQLTLLRNSYKMRAR